jgi:hypothetical protein
MRAEGEAGHVNLAFWRCIKKGFFSRLEMTTGRYFQSFSTISNRTFSIRKSRVVGSKLEARGRLAAWTLALCCIITLLFYHALQIGFFRYWLQSTELKEFVRYSMN